MIRRARLLLQFQIARAFVAPVAPPVPGVLMAAKDLSRINLYILLVWFSDLFVRKPRRTKDLSGNYLGMCLPAIPLACRFRHRYEHGLPQCRRQQLKLTCDACKCT